MLLCSQLRKLHARTAVTVLTTLIGLIPSLALGHTIEGSDANFVQAIDGPAIAPFIYLGAKHMVTGYDHLLFLVGVIFFLYRPKHVIEYVTLFAVGHSISLLLGVLADLRVNAYLIDAVIDFCSGILIRPIFRGRRIRPIWVIFTATTRLRRVNSVYSAGRSNCLTSQSLRCFRPQKTTTYRHSDRSTGLPAHSVVTWSSSCPVQAILQA